MRPFFWPTQTPCLLKVFYHGLLPERQNHGHGASSYIRRDLSYERLGENKKSCNGLTDWLTAVVLTVSNTFDSMKQFATWNSEIVWIVNGLCHSGPLSFLFFLSTSLPDRSKTILLNKLCYFIQFWNKNVLTGGTVCQGVAGIQVWWVKQSYGKIINGFNEQIV